MLQRAFPAGLLGITVSAVGFALLHIDPHHVAGVLPLGFFLAWVAYRTDSTGPSIAAHVTNNTLAIVAARHADLDVGYGTERDMPLWWVPAGAGITAACALVIVLSTRRAVPVPPMPRAG
jgi:membrane protease YdiL (CAAX protease family)